MLSYVLYPAAVAVETVQDWAFRYNAWRTPSLAELNDKKRSPQKDRGYSAFHAFWDPLEKLIFRISNFVSSSARSIVTSVSEALPKRSTPSLETIVEETPRRVVTDTLPRTTAASLSIIVDTPKPAYKNLRAMTVPEKVVRHPDPRKGMATLLCLDDRMEEIPDGVDERVYGVVSLSFRDSQIRPNGDVARTYETAAATYQKRKTELLRAIGEEDATGVKKMELGRSLYNQARRFEATRRRLRDFKLYNIVREDMENRANNDKRIYVSRVAEVVANMTGEGFTTTYGRILNEIKRRKEMEKREPAPATYVSAKAA